MRFARPALSSHVIDPIVQKGAMDCGVAAVTMMLGQSYPIVAEAALTVDPTVHETGLTRGELKKLVRKLGFRIQTRSVQNNDDFTGIVFMKRVRKSEWHWIVMFQGVVINPADGMVWDFDTYCASKEMAALEYLVVL